MRNWTLASVVLAAAGFCAAPAVAQERITEQPAKVGPVVSKTEAQITTTPRRGLFGRSRRQMVTTVSEPTTTTSTVVQAQAIETAPTQTVQVAEYRQGGLRSRLRSRLGR